MPVTLTQKHIDTLKKHGITTLLRPGAVLPDATVFEPPCSLKWMNVQHSLRMGAFSYAVSGFYFGCRIGRYCSFGEQVQVGRHPHPMHWFSTSPFFYSPYNNVLDQDIPEGLELVAHRDFKRSAPPVSVKITIIRNDVWIGHGAFILPGVKIGNGAVIAAMAVVTKDVPSYAVVAGCPAKVVRYRFPDKQIKKLVTSKWWQFAPWQLKGAQVDDITAFVNYVHELRQSGVEPYKADHVGLRDLI